MSAPRPSQPRPPRRTAAAIVATVVLLCQGAAWVHASATPHVTCLEHGESVHLPAALATPPGPDGSPDALAAAPEAVAHGHEHCGLQGQRTTSVSSPSDEGSTTSFAPTPARAVVEPRPTVGLLRLAPKTSPPRAPIA